MPQSNENFGWELLQGYAEGALGLGTWLGRETLGSMGALADYAVDVVNPATPIPEFKQLGLTQKDLVKALEGLQYHPEETGVMNSFTAAPGELAKDIGVMDVLEHVSPGVLEGLSDPNVTSAMVALEAIPFVGAAGKAGKAISKLPMDEASRMARAKEMGFSETPYYHQTSKTNEQLIERGGFDINQVGARGDDPEVPDGIFLKAHKEDIGLGSADKEQVAQMELMTRMENPLILNDRNDVRRYFGDDNEYFELLWDADQIDKTIAQKYDMLEASLKRKVERAKKAGKVRGDKEIDSAYREYFDAADELFAQGKIDSREAAAKARARLTEILRERGYDGMVIKNDHGSMGRNVMTTVVLDPEKLRSTKAAFDPDKAMSPEIMASLVAAMTGAGVYGAQE